jgi:hypothetical protein
MQNLEPVLDFQIFNLITRADIVSVQSILSHLRHFGGSGVTGVGFRIRCNWKIGPVPEINELAAPKPKSRDTIGVLVATRAAWYFSTWHQVVPRRGPSAIQYRHGAWST